MSRLAFLNGLATYEMVPGNRPTKKIQNYIKLQIVWYTNGNFNVKVQSCYLKFNVGYLLNLLQNYPRDVNV